MGVAIPTTSPVAPLRSFIRRTHCWAHGGFHHRRSVAGAVGPVASLRGKHSWLEKSRLLQLENSMVFTAMASRLPASRITSSVVVLGDGIRISNHSKLLVVDIYVAKLRILWGKKENATLFRGNQPINHYHYQPSPTINYPD